MVQLAFYIRNAIMLYILLIIYTIFYSYKDSSADFVCFNSKIWYKNSIWKCWFRSTDIYRLVYAHDPVVPKHSPSCISICMRRIRHRRALKALSSHYSDFLKGAMPSQITSLAIVYSTIPSGADQRKYQSSASLDFVTGDRLIHLTKGQ